MGSRFKSIPCILGCIRAVSGYMRVRHIIAHNRNDLDSDAAAEAARNWVEDVRTWAESGKSGAA
jgi:hypothetical protein